MVIVKWTSDLAAKMFLFTMHSHGGLTPKIACLHRTLFRAKLYILYLKYVPKSFLE